jgi:SAM-dependent methyltransferase
MKQNVSLKYYAAKLFQYARTNGLRSSAALVGKNLIWPICQWVVRRRIRGHERFDEKYGLDTQTPVAARDLELANPIGRFAHRYEGTPIPLIHKIIRRLGTDLRRFTFIDLGSGKGRVLLIASQYPFKSIIGVEFSERLHNISQANIARFADLGLAKVRPNSIKMDATEVDFSPLGDKIIFCNNPFSASLMLKVIDNLEISLARSKDDAILIYLTPISPQIVQRLSKFRMIYAGNYISDFGGFQKYLIYQISQKEQAAAPGR